MSRKQKRSSSGKAPKRRRFSSREKAAYYFGAGVAAERYGGVDHVIYSRDPRIAKSAADGYTDVYQKRIPERIGGKTR